MHAARLVVGSEPAVIVEAGRVGFRTLAPGPPGHEIERDGLSLHVNGVPIFARGALWTPLDIVGLDPSPAELRAALETVTAAGMNMLRVPGFGPYEQDAFHDLCDELGVLVWQDLMFASMDYPFADEGFLRIASAEVGDVAARLAGRPSTAVLCGNSEVEQQVAMLGLDIALAPAFRSSTRSCRRSPRRRASTPCTCPPRHSAASCRCGRTGASRTTTASVATEGRCRMRGPAGSGSPAECLAFANVPDEEAPGDARSGAAGRGVRPPSPLEGRGRA